MSRQRLQVLCGFPGAGKSTWAAQQPGFVVLSADAMRTLHVRPHLLFAQLTEELRRLLAEGRSVIWDACSTRTSNRFAPRNIAQPFNVQHELVVFCTPWNICRERDRARGAEASGVDWAKERDRMAQTLRAVYLEQWDAVHYVPHQRPASQWLWCGPEERHG